MTCRGPWIVNQTSDYLLGNLSFEADRRTTLVCTVVVILLRSVGDETKCRPMEVNAQTHRSPFATQDKRDDPCRYSGVT